MNIEQVINLLCNFDDTEALWAVYHRGLVADIADREPTDQEWADIMDEFTEVASDIFEALAGAFVESVSNNMSDEEE
jgi:hypothetical protein